MMTTDDAGELVVLQHADVTGPDNLVPTLEARAEQLPWRTVALDREPVPALTDRIRGLLVLGGPMGVHDRDAFPWIDDELALLRDAVDHGVPVFGICLGAQLLGEALGGEVSRRDTPEVGVFGLDRTEDGVDDELFAGWPQGGQVLLSHQDQVSRLPDGAVPMLTGTDGVPAWRVGDDDGGVYAVQFHPEVSAEGLATWVARDELRGMYDRAGIDTDALVDDLRRREPFLRAVGVSLVGRWIDGWVNARKR